MHEIEKPYVIQYEPHGDIPGTNIKSVKLDDVPIRDLRPEKGSLCFETDGIFIRNMESKMEYEDFATPAIVQKIYLEEIHLHLQDMLGTQIVAIAEYLVYLTRSLTLYLNSITGPSPSPAVPSRPRNVLQICAARRDGAYR